MKKLASLLVLFSPLVLAHCSGTQSVICPPGLQLNAEGTACECPPGQVLLNDMCVDEGLCAGVSCDDGNSCTVDGACSPDTGQCPVKTFASIDTACDLDSGAGRCMDGVCTEIPAVCIGVVCDDENDCTKNVCQDNAGTAVCVYPNEDNTKACDAGGNPGFCDGDGECAGLCVGVGCDDGDECTVDGDCDPATGMCPAKIPLNCDDGDACTADTCDAQIGCIGAFIDNDGDGYAPFECSAESPHQGSDCHDTLAERNPGQTMYFSTPT